MSDQQFSGSSVEHSFHLLLGNFRRSFLIIGSHQQNNMTMGSVAIKGKDQARLSLSHRELQQYNWSKVWLWTVRFSG